ncbi:hypothetical protein O181_071326 [Austropuccinia psidii MF-1]|uniref:Uncharacterized protein n=1 Tax=Austropuccinia psidii MF-1 TaxID=1389203 RepID=A0A9Q3I6F4_9BASI|nr:hypothetical protein [Austropuccinia psidii MF-1]
MTPTRSGSNYSIQSNGSGPGHSSHKSKRQECQPIGEAQIEDARTSTSSQRHHELISSSEEVHGARKDRRTSEGLETHVLQRTSPTDKSFVLKQKHVVRGPEENVGPMEGKQHSGSSPSLHKKTYTSKSVKKSQGNPKDQPEGQEKEKGKANPKWNKPYQQNYRIPKKVKTAMENVFNMARTLMEFKNKEEERLNQSFPKKKIL